MNLAAIAGIPVVAVAEVVLHVAAPDVQFGVEVGELAEDRTRSLPHDARQHVESAAVGHPEHDLFDSLIGRLVNGQFQQRDQRLSPFQREALRPLELFKNELLKHHRVAQSLENAPLFIGSQLQPIFGRLHPSLKPLSHGQVVDVHELRADGTAVGVTQPLQDFTQRSQVGTTGSHRRELAVHVAQLETAGVGFQLGNTRTWLAEWVNVGGIVAHTAIVADQSIDALLQNCVIEFGGTHQSRLIRLKWTEQALAVLVVNGESMCFAQLAEVVSPI